jgi:hypothetical protein
MQRRLLVNRNSSHSPSVVVIAARLCKHICKVDLQIIDSLVRLGASRDHKIYLQKCDGIPPDAKRARATRNQVGEMAGALAAALWGASHIRKHRATPHRFRYMHRNSWFLRSLCRCRFPETC